MQFSGCNRQETDVVARGASLANPNNFCGGFGAREIPVPIPNTAVKPRSADDTARATLWESKSPPRSFFKQPASIEAGCFVLSASPRVNH